MCGYVITIAWHVASLFLRGNNTASGDVHLEMRSLKTLVALFSPPPPEIFTGL